MSCQARLHACLCCVAAPQVPAEEWDRLVRASSSAPASDSQGQQPQQQEDWNPFVSHTFLSILERSRSACPQEGWAPQHILLRRRRRNRDGKGKGTGAAAAGDGGDAAEAAEEEEQVGELVGAVPLYLKGHSYGEYVFDSSWANYCTMLGQRYYPKSVLGVGLDAREHEGSGLGIPLVLLN